MAMRRRLVFAGLLAIAVIGTAIAADFNDVVEGRSTLSSPFTSADVIPVVRSSALYKIPIPTLVVAPLATGTSVTLVAPRQYYVCSSTCSVTPPFPAAGYEFCVINGNNVSTVITMVAIGSSGQYENTARTAYGTAGTGTMVSGGAVGDKVCLLGLDSTHYMTFSFSGVWTVN